MAVKFRSHSVCASCSFVRPRAEMCFSSQRSPTTAWLLSASSPGPSECFDVTRICVGDSAPTKMMHPFDFSVSVYGAAVRAFSAAH